MDSDKLIEIAHKQAKELIKLDLTRGEKLMVINTMKFALESEIITGFILGNGVTHECSVCNAG